MRKGFRAGAVVIGLGLLVSACGDDEGATATTASSGPGGVECSGIELAYLGPTSGESGQLGRSMVDAAKIALDEWNVGNENCTMEMNVFDSQGIPQQATRLADQIVEDRSIIALLGPGSSGETKVTMPKFEEAGLVVISPSAADAHLQTNGWKTFHRVVANEDTQGPAIAKLIRSKGAQKVGVIDDASADGKALADSVRRELGALKVVDDVIDPNGSEYSAAVNGMKAAGTDFIFYGGSGAQAALLLKQLRAGGVTAVFVAGDRSLDPRFVDAAGALDAEGALFTSIAAPANVNPDFQRKFNDKFKKDPTLYAPESYDAVNVFLDAIAAGEQDRKSILELVEAYDQPGITKQIKFDTTGDVAGEAVYSYEVEDGKINWTGIVK